MALGTSAGLEGTLAALPIPATLSFSVLHAIVSTPGLRVICAACGEGVINQREVKTGVVTP